MLELEPPRHSRLRGLVLRAFTSKKVAAMAPEIIRDLPQVDRQASPPSPLTSSRPLPVPCRCISSPNSWACPPIAVQILLSWSNAMVAMYQSNRSYETEIAANQATLDFTAFPGQLHRPPPQPASATIFCPISLPLRKPAKSSPVPS